jgi:hypothetical protein
MDRLASIFGAGATPKRLRKAVAELRPLDTRPPPIPRTVWLPVDERRGFVTPEGRVVLEQLRRLREENRDSISTGEIASAADLVAGIYRGWQQQWIERTLTGAGLRPGSYGWVLLLLVNGSVTRETALRLPSDENEERRLAGVLIPVIDAFAEELGREAQSAREAARLRSNWRVTQARALLFEIVNRADAGSGDAFFWVEPESKAVDVLGHRLAERKGLDVDTLARAFDQFRRAYEQARPTLSAFAAAHDRPSHTDYVLDAITESFTRTRANA